MSSLLVSSGFSDPVHNAQHTFRSVLSALAEPALPQSVEVTLPNLGVSDAALAIVLTLTDFDTLLWLSPSIAAHSDMCTYLQFHTGAPITANPAEADFALASSVDDLPEFTDFCLGSAMVPESSTTVILDVSDFTSGEPAQLEGPGFSQPRRLAPAGFNRVHWDQLRKNHSRFPAGIDLLLCCERRVIGLPRSSTIEFVERAEFMSDEKYFDHEQSETGH